MTWRKDDTSVVEDHGEQVVVDDTKGVSGTGCQFGLAPAPLFT